MVWENGHPELQGSRMGPGGPPQGRRIESVVTSGPAGLAWGQEGELGLMGPHPGSAGTAVAARGPPERPAGWSWPTYKEVRGAQVG